MFNNNIEACLAKLKWNIQSVIIFSNCPYFSHQPSIGLRPVHMIPGELIALGQLTDPGVNFASAHGLTPVTADMSFSLHRETSRDGLPIVQHRVTRLAEVTFLHVNRMQKLSWGKSSLAHAHYSCSE